MRSIIHEMAYERPLSSGQWRYQRDGEPTGAVEEWKLTEAVDGYRFLRVDLDARAAPSGRSTIYHVLLDSSGNAVQVKYRFWSSAPEIIGTLLLEEEAVILTRETIAGRQDDVLPLPRGYLFWFPATAGLSLLAGRATLQAGTAPLQPGTAPQEQTAVTLRTEADEQGLLMGLVKTRVSLEAETSVDLAVLDGDERTRPLNIRWADQRRTIWVDAEGWPLMMERGDGLTAVLSRRIHYGHITGPGGGGGQRNAGA